jgi:biopolymer transport protein ExbD
MSKHKLPRKSTNIDMTAMCDVAFLLLTFFMLATKFKPDEPVVVKTPSSTSNFILPDSSILLTVDPTGRVFLDYQNRKAKEYLITMINDEKKLGLTEEEKKAFVIGASFGMPMKDMKGFLSKTPLEQKEVELPGIPIDTSYVANTNELGYWVQAARSAGQSLDSKNPPKICIKCDATTPYPKVKDVIKTLTRNQIDRFNLLTSLEEIPEGTALFNSTRR